MVNYLKSFLGRPYKWGGNHPSEGLDCSGLVCEGLKSVGFLKTREDLTSQQIYERLQDVPYALSTDRRMVKGGEIIFFGKSADKITHIAVAINAWQMIEAGGGDSRVKTVEDAIKRNASVRIRPINYRKDLVAITRLPY